MKYLYKLGLIVLFLSVLGCFSDDQSDRFIQLQIVDALRLENQKDYIVGDTIFFDVQFSRYLDEEGFSNKLDVYETTKAEAFDYNFGLSKFSSFSQDFQPVTINPDFVFAEKGSVFDGFNNTAAVINEEKNQYESRVGLVLPEAGSFRFDFDFLRFFPQNHTFSRDEVIIEINHEFTNFIPEDFEFVVTE